MRTGRSDFGMYSPQPPDDRDLDSEVPILSGGKDEAKGRPGQDGQARPLAEPGGGARGWCCHRLDPSAAARAGGPSMARGLAAGLATPG